MDIDFELSGEIADAETSQLVPRSENCETCEHALDMGVGASEMGLPTCGSVVVRYGLLKCIGTKLTGLVK